MLAYEVAVNGERVTRAGIADWAVMSVIVSMVRGDSGDHIDYTLNIGGLSRDRQDHAEHVRWKTPTIAIGSEIQIKIVECDHPDAPTKRYRCDREVQESSFTEEEIREMRYQTYLELKTEFEGLVSP